MNNSWFGNDFQPSAQQWTLVDKDFATDLPHEDSEIFIFNDTQPIDQVSSQIQKQDSQQISTQSNSPPRSQTAQVSNYIKNICSYISKKIVLDLINPKSEKFVRRLCRKAGCRFQDVIDYYTKQSKEIFGINHLAMMITPQNESQVNIKKMFCVYLNWFLRNKYMFYMLKNGKMDEKDKYIQFKNKYLLYISKVESQYQKYL